MIDGRTFELGMSLEEALKIAPNIDQVSNRCDLHSSGPYREESSGWSRLSLAACVRQEPRTPGLPREMGALWFDKGRLTRVQKTWGIYYHDSDSLKTTDDLIAALDVVTGGQTKTMMVSVETRHNEEGRWEGITLYSGPYKITIARLSNPTRLTETATLLLELTQLVPAK